MKCFCGRFPLANELGVFYEGSQSKHTARMCVNRSQRKAVLYERGRYEEWRGTERRVGYDVTIMAAVAQFLAQRCGALYQDAGGYYFWRTTPDEEREAAK